MELDAIFVVSREILHLLVELIDLVADIEVVDFLFCKTLIEFLIVSLNERGHVLDV